jgi:hypothetical protein
MATSETELTPEDFGIAEVYVYAAGQLDRYDVFAWAAAKTHGVNLVVCDEDHWSVALAEKYVATTLSTLGDAKTPLTDQMLRDVQAVIASGDIAILETRGSREHGVFAFPRAELKDPEGVTLEGDLVSRWTPGVNGGNPS